MLSPEETGTVSVDKSRVAICNAVLVLLYIAPVVVLLHENSSTGVSPSGSEEVAEQLNVSLRVGEDGVNVIESTLGERLSTTIETDDEVLPPWESDTNAVH